MATNSPYLSGLEPSLSDKEGRTDPFYKAYLKKQEEAEKAGGLPPMAPMQDLSGLAQLEYMSMLQGLQPTQPLRGFAHGGSVNPMHRYAEGGLVIGGVKISEAMAREMATVAYAESVDAKKDESKRILSTMINRASLSGKPISDVLTYSQYNAIREDNKLYTNPPKAKIDALVSQIKEMAATGDITTDTHYLTPAQLATGDQKWARMANANNAFSQTGAHMFTSLDSSIDPNYGGIKNISARENVLYGPTGVPAPSYRPDPRFSDPIYGWNDPVMEAASLANTVPTAGTMSPEQLDAFFTDYQKYGTSLPPEEFDSAIDTETLLKQLDPNYVAPDDPRFRTAPFTPAEMAGSLDSILDPNNKYITQEMLSQAKPSSIPIPRARPTLPTDALQGSSPVLSPSLMDFQGAYSADLPNVEPASDEPYNEWSSSKYPSNVADQQALDDAEIGASFRKVVDPQSINSPANQSMIKSIYEEQMRQYDPVKMQDRITDTPTYMGMPGYAATIATPDPNTTVATRSVPTTSVKGSPEAGYRPVGGAQYITDAGQVGSEMFNDSLDVSALNSYLNEPYDAADLTPKEATRFTDMPVSPYEREKDPLATRVDQNIANSQIARNAADEAAYQAAIARTLTPSRVEKDPYLAARSSLGLDTDSIALDIGTDSLGGAPRALDPVDVMGSPNAPQSYLEATPRSNPYSMISPNTPSLPGTQGPDFLAAKADMATAAAARLAAAARNVPQAAPITSTITAPQAPDMRVPNVPQGVRPSPYPEAPKATMPADTLALNVGGFRTPVSISDRQLSPNTAADLSSREALSPITQKGFEYVSPSPMNEAIRKLDKQYAPMDKEEATAPYSKPSTGEISSISAPTSRVDARALNSYNSVLNDSQQNINTEYGKAIAEANALQPNGVSNVNMQNLKGNMPRMDLVRAIAPEASYRGPITASTVMPNAKVSPGSMPEMGPGSGDLHKKIAEYKAAEAAKMLSRPADNYTSNPKPDNSRLSSNTANGYEAGYGGVGDTGSPSVRQQAEQMKAATGKDQSGSMASGYGMTDWNDNISFGKEPSALNPTVSAGGGRGGGGAAGRATSNAGLEKAMSSAIANTKAGPNITAARNTPGSGIASGKMQSTGFASGDLASMIAEEGNIPMEGFLPGAQEVAPVGLGPGGLPPVTASQIPSTVGSTAARSTSSGSASSLNTANGPAGLAGTGGSMSSRNASYSNNQSSGRAGSATNSQTSYDSKGNTTGRSYTDSKGRQHSTTTIGGKEYTNASGSSGAGSGGGGTILCTYFMKKGWLPAEIWRADMTHAKTVNPIMREGYYAWAEPCITRMKVGDKKSRILEHILWQVVKGWSYEAAYMSGYLPSGTIYGKIIRAIFEPMSYAIGKFKRMINSNKKVEV